MRLSTALVSLSVVLGASPACASCVPSEKIISPGDKVMVICNDYPKGSMNHSPSVEDCALRCENTANICSYEPKSKQCIVASANGTPAMFTGVISMTSIKSDCCPELQTCKDENTKCAGDLADALKKIDDKDKELQQSQKDLDSCKNLSGSGGSGGSGTPGTGTPPDQKPLNPATCGEYKAAYPHAPLI